MEPRITCKVPLDTGDSDVVVARVTTQAYSTAYDVPVKDWAGAGLLAASTIRVHKIATLEKSLIQRHLGTLGTADWHAVATAMRRAYGAP